jgi:ABC-type transport system involved in cytochrome c biogenesis permease component
MLASRMPTLGEAVHTIVVCSLVAIPMSAQYTLFHLVSGGNRFKEILLPLLIFPASLPLFIVAVDVLSYDSTLEHFYPLAGLAGLYLTISLFLAHYLFLEED